MAVLWAGGKLENIPMAKPRSEPLGLLLPSPKTNCIQVYHYEVHKCTDFYRSNQVFTMHSKNKYFSINQGQIHFTARPQNLKPVCCMCTTTNKKKFGVLILFMKTPKIFSKVTGGSVCAL